MRWTRLSLLFLSPFAWMRTAPPPLTRAVSSTPQRFSGFPLSPSKFSSSYFLYTFFFSIIAVPVPPPTIRWSFIGWQVPAFRPFSAFFSAFFFSFFSTISPRRPVTSLIFRFVKPCFLRSWLFQFDFVLPIGCSPATLPFFFYWSRHPFPAFSGKHRPSRRADLPQSMAPRATGWVLKSPLHRWVSHSHWSGNRVRRPPFPRVCLLGEHQMRFSTLHPSLLQRSSFVASRTSVSEGVGFNSRACLPDGVS